MSVSGSLIQQPVGQGSGIAASGTVTILAGNNSVTYAHGLGRTPKAIVGATNDTGTTFYFSTDGTNLYVYLSAGGLALQNCTFSYVLI